MAVPHYRKDLKRAFDLVYKRVSTIRRSPLDLNGRATHGRAIESSEGGNCIKRGDFQNPLQYVKTLGRRYPNTVNKCARSSAGQCWNYGEHSSSALEQTLSKEVGKFSMPSLLSTGIQGRRAINHCFEPYGTRNIGQGRRFYYVDRNNVQHFRPRGPRRWIDDPRKVLVIVVLSSGLVLSVYFSNLETVPYSHRKHFVLISDEMEKKIGENQFEEMKKMFKPKILPAIHPQSVRVRLIAKDIIEALQRGTRHQESWSDVAYSNTKTIPSDVHTSQDPWGLRSENEYKEEQLYGNDEILDDKWVENSRKSGKERGDKASTQHLKAFNWEILVVDDPIVNAFCLPGGKIMVFTGLLNAFPSDAEIATVISHEVGHAVARHAAEGMTSNLWFAILQIIILQFIGMPDVVHAMSNLLLKLPFSRRMEVEADYIGLLLMASAGYDPRVASSVYEKLGKLSGDSVIKNYLSTHPSGKKRAELLKQAKVMEEALGIYRERISGHGIEGFL